MTYRAFVLDVDGTICDYNGLLNLDAIHSIRWLRGLGYEVILATGRGPWDSYYLSVFIGCSKPVVCENGGVLMDSPGGIRLYSDKSSSLEAYDHLAQNFQDVKLKPVSARLTEVVLLRTFDPARGQKSIDRKGLPVKINDSKFALHLTKKGIDKTVALRDCLKLLGIAPSDVIVIGDSATDLPMFEFCGYSAAVANASDEVKSKANYVCKNEIGDGVVEAISHFAEKLLKES